MKARGWEELASQGRTLEAIVAYRASAGVGLSEAKDAVERWMDINLPPSLDYIRAKRVGERIAAQLNAYSSMTGRVISYWINLVASSPTELSGRSPIVHAELPEDHRGRDLLVEIELPGVPRKDRGSRVRSHLAQQVGMVWVAEFDPPALSVIIDPSVYRSYHPGATFGCGDLLPGFTCKVADLFA